MRELMKLIYTDPEGREHSLDLHASTTVGRSEESDLVMDDEKASRMHFAIYKEDGTYVLHDLQSRNGTYLNGSRVDVHPLKSGDQIRAGSVHFRFQGDEVPGANTAIHQVQEQMQDGQGYGTILRKIVSDTKPKRPLDP
jgi:pSer/pThr/pTyr-binding forkhead associated (FHA) protein